MIRRGNKSNGVRRRGTIWQRIDAVIIPGTTGGLYTTIPGFIILMTTLAVYVLAYFENKKPPEEFRDLLIAAVSLLGLHNGRAIFNARGATSVAKEGIDNIGSGEEITISTPEGSVKAKKEKADSDWTEEELEHMREGAKG